MEKLYQSINSCWYSFAGFQIIVLMGLVLPRFMDSPFLYKTVETGDQLFFHSPLWISSLAEPENDRVAPFSESQNSYDMLPIRGGAGFLAENAPAHAKMSICSRTEDVRNAILRLIPNESDCGQVTSVQLAAITGILDVGYKGITSLNPGDFEGLTALEALSLGDNSFKVLPAGIFDDLASLKVLYLWGNSFASLPDGVFSPLTSLMWLYLEENELSALHPEIFSGLTSLTVLDLSGNQLSTLPDGAFDGLASLESLDLSGNRLSVLPNGIFNGLASLEVLELSDNSFRSISDGVFDGLASLKRISLSENLLEELSAGQLDQLGALESLDLSGNKFGTLSSGLFDGLNSLKSLNLSRNSLKSLSSEVFQGLASLEVLGLWENSLSELSGGVFDGLISLNVLSLRDNALGVLLDGVLENLTQLPLSTYDSEYDYYDYPGLSLSGNPGAPFQPIVDAGTDQSVGQGATVSLQGSATGPWGALARWEWVQVDGQNSNRPVQDSQIIRLTGEDTAVPGFTAPMAAGEIHFKAVATPAGLGAPAELWGHMSSESDWVTVRIDMSTDATPASLVTEFASLGNYPNPFNPSTRILVDLPERAAVSVDIFNMLGQRVHRADLAVVDAGYSRPLELAIAGLPSGMYVYLVTARMGSGVQIAKGRMTLIK